MKVIMLKGTTHTGKTTTAVAIIRELRRRGYTVGSVKDIHYEQFTMETEGTNTDPHKKAGAQLVTARGRSETDIMYDRMLDIDDILDFYTQDWVVLEGDSGANCPIIATARTEADLQNNVTDRTIAISGVISGTGINSYKGLPVIDGTCDIQQLVDLIEARTPERMPNYSAACCTACGGDCRQLTERILKGTGSISECILKGQDTSLFIDGREIPMVPFVRNILRNVVKGTVSTLDGYRDGCSIEIKIK